MASFCQIIVSYVKQALCIFWGSCVNASNFRTRANRREYITFHAVWFVLNITCLLFLYVNLEFMKNFYIVINVILFLPSYSVAIRRVHDFNMSGWTYFFIHLTTFVITIFIMFYNKSINLGEIELSTLEMLMLYLPLLIYITLIFFKGTSCNNNYGEPPTNQLTF